jgi:chromate transporter
MAVVTFGGAYAVLAYVAQEAVERYGWLAADEMLSGLALAETTPGPLILVVQFVGFLAGYRDPGALAPMLAGAIAGTLAVWVTFVPSFLWIFLGAPYVERLQNNRALNGALKAITAAVVGVIANLAVWFGLQVIFEKIAFVDRFGLRVPIADLGTIDAVAAGIAVASIAAQVRYKVGMIPTLVGAAAIGIVWRLLVA